MPKSKGMTLSRSILLLFLTLTLSAPALADTRLYEVLGVKKGATLAQIEEGFLRQSKRKDLTELDRANLAAAYSLLSDHDLRRQYDEGKGQDLEVPLTSDGQNLADLAVKLETEKTSGWQKAGHFTVDTGASMGVFYVATGISEAWECYRTRDPVFCKAFLKGLKEKSGYFGFFLFALNSRLISNAAVKVLGEKAFAQTVAGMAGMAGGALSSDLFSEFYHHPQTKEYLKTFHIKDEKERAEKRQSALRKLYKETFGDKDWRTDKVPGIVSMVVASFASEVTWAAGEKLLQKGRIRGARLATRLAHGHASLECVSGVTDAVTPALPEGGNPRGRFAAFTAKRGTELAQILLFMAYSNLLNKPASSGWEKVTLDRRIQAERIKLGIQDRLPGENRRTAVAGKPQVTSQDLEQLSKDWDNYRRKRMSEIEQSMALHQEEVTSLDKEIDKADSFYKWLAAGLSTEDPAWINLRDVYYFPDTTPKDLNKDVEKYARAFFCGPEPAKSFRDSTDLHGLPIPGRMDEKVTPYRVAEKIDPELCKASSEKLLAHIKDGDFHDQIIKTHSLVQAQAHEIRREKIDFYEQQVDRDIVRILDHQKSETHGLPASVLDAFDMELGDLRKLLDRVGQDPMSQEVAKRIKQVEEKRQAAQELLDYMKTPRDQREVPGLDIDSLAEGIRAAGEDQDPTQKTKSYFRGFIIR